MIPTWTAKTAAISGLALLNLAALRSPAAFGDYVTIGTPWLLALISSDARGRRGFLWLLVGSWILLFVCPDVFPLGDFAPRTFSFVITIAETALVVAINTWILFRREPPEE